MLPTTTFAAFLLIALVPGYAYLRLTEDARRPRDNSTLDEFLEVLAVGMGTTGLAAVLCFLIRPHEVARAIRNASLDAPDALKRAIIIGALIAVTALAFACLGACATRLPGKGSYSPNVWRATLGLRRKGHLPYVVLELKDDDRRIRGVLHSYTTLDGDHPRDIAVMNPEIARDGKTWWDSGAGFLLVSAERIEKVWFSLAPDPGQPK